MRKIAFTATIAFSLLLVRGTHAIHRGANDLPYSQSMDHPRDKPLNREFDGKCFFMNLGPTGIRARIDPDDPKAFKVMYVFQDTKSPAKGKIRPGDMIIGANGRRFENPHGFHRKHAGARGWQGPPYELAMAIEDSQGKDGKLELLVFQGGVKQRETVTLQLKPVGRFSETYPWNCPRSEELLEDLCDFMIDNGISGRHHYQVQQLLALWAADERKAMPLIRAKAESLMSRPANYKSTGMCTWGWGYSGIFLGEFYNMTKDKRVVPAAAALAKAYELGQDWRSGGYSHRPFPAIQQRIASGGPKGYGAMAGPGGLAMLAQSIFKETGLPYSKRAYFRTHQAYLQTAGGNSRASIAYGFKGWEHAVLNLVNNSMARSGKGVGYIVPEGMKGIGGYSIGWPTKSDPRWKPTDWVKREADSNSIFEQKDWRMAVRTVHPTEPTKPYDTQPGGGGHVAPMGMGAAAHFIGNQGNESWNYLGKHLAAGCALSPGMLFDGHADATMHSFFSVLGAARADEEHLRSYLDYAKTWIILSEPHDGQGLVDQPFGCQRNATCSISRNRTAYTHTAILLLSLPRRNLLITGADMGAPAEPSRRRPSTSRSTPSPVTAKPMPPPLRSPRYLPAAQQARLDGALRRALAELDTAGELREIVMPISVSRSDVWLSGAPEDEPLVFHLAGGEMTADVRWDALSRRDIVKLAVLVATLKAGSSDAQAVAGVYLESIGRVSESDRYYDKAGEESVKKFEALFETGTE